MSDFDALWRSSVRFRKVSHELEPLLHAVHNAFGDDAALTAALERVLVFLTTAEGRTDANCSGVASNVFAMFGAWMASWRVPPMSSRIGASAESRHRASVAEMN